jgi:hypothetical protein
MLLVAGVEHEAERSLTDMREDSRIKRTVLIMFISLLLSFFTLSLKSS